MELTIKPCTNEACDGTMTLHMHRRKLKWVCQEKVSHTEDAVPSDVESK